MQFDLWSLWSSTSAARLLLHGTVLSTFCPAAVSRGSDIRIAPCPAYHSDGLTISLNRDQNTAEQTRDPADTGIERKSVTTTSPSQETFDIQTMSSTSSIQNRAAFLDEPGTPLRVGDAPTPVPDPEEVLIEVHAVAINPVDTARQAAGFNIPSYPWISGSDAAGVAKAVGADVSNVKPGKSSSSILAVLVQGTSQDLRS